MTINPSLTEPAFDFAQDLVLSSDVPLLMLDRGLRVLVASRSFCDAFQFNPSQVNGRSIAHLGSGEWDSPPLATLLEGTASGMGEVKAYELKLHRFDRPPRLLVINAHKLDHPNQQKVRVVLSVEDMTDIRNDAVQIQSRLRMKRVLLQELQHRVANSLQIIASVLMQSARAMQSDESKWHIYDAHSRVMSIAELQRQLSNSTVHDVLLKPYLVNLSQSISSSLIRDRNLVSIEVEADDSIVNAATSIGLGLIVTELIINALKHAFPGERAGTIAIAYRCDEAGWTLSVRDNGIGIIARDDTRVGLGANIVKALAAQLDAEIMVADAMPGTQISLRNHQSLSDGASLEDRRKANLASRPPIARPH